MGGNRRSCAAAARSLAAAARSLAVARDQDSPAATPAPPAAAFSFLPLYSAQERRKGQASPGVCLMEGGCGGEPAKLRGGGAKFAAAA